MLGCFERRLSKTKLSALHCSSEQELYTDGDFTQDEPYYRRGFEAAQSPMIRGKSYEEALDYLTRKHEIAASHPAFRRGYERGREYCEKTQSGEPLD